MIGVLRYLKGVMISAVLKPAIYVYAIHNLQDIRGTYHIDILHSAMVTDALLLHTQWSSIEHSYVHHQNRSRCAILNCITNVVAISTPTARSGGGRVAVLGFSWSDVKCL